jgi:uncharacterized protein (TIGR03435 family)
VRCLFILLASVACAQPSFDVASLKPSPPLEGDLININLGTARNGEVELSNASLSDCLNFAYGLVSSDQLAGPDWIKSKVVRFDIRAKAAPSTSREQLLLMLRTLLTERFHLQFHTEQRSFAHMVLTVGKNGTKLKEVTPDPATAKSRYLFGHLTGNQMRMHNLALMLSRYMRQLVLDETGLTGAYDIDLTWTPEGQDADTGPTIFTAVQEQLGLKLEGRKDAVAVMVIDHADRTPVEN